MKTQTILIIGLILLLVVGAGYFLTKTGGPASQAEASPQPTPIPGVVTVEMKQFVFMPQTITISQGETVTWINNDPVPHTITGFGIDEELTSGQSFQYTFEEKGTYPYLCTLHEGMKGEVIVK